MPGRIADSPPVRIPSQPNSAGCEIRSPRKGVHSLTPVRVSRVADRHEVPWLSRAPGALSGAVAAAPSHPPPRPRAAVPSSARPRSATIPRCKRRGAGSRRGRHRLTEAATARLQSSAAALSLTGRLSRSLPLRSRPALLARGAPGRPNRPSRSRGTSPAASRPPPPCPRLAPGP